MQQLPVIAINVIIAMTRASDDGGAGGALAPHFFPNNAFVEFI